jgi:outer membrane beta-barrel protein
MFRFELTPFGGDYFGDKLNHSFVVGGDLQWNITEKLALAADFAYSQAAVTGGTALAASFTNKNAYMADGSFVVTVPAIYKSKKGYTEADFYTSLGAGLVRTNSTNRFGGFVGGGMKIRPKWKWIAIRVDIRNYFTSIPNPAGSDFEDDLTIRIGPTFLLPPEF